MSGGFFGSLGGRDLPLHPEFSVGAQFRCYAPTDPPSSRPCYQILKSSFAPISIIFTTTTLSSRLTATRSRLPGPLHDRDALSRCGPASTLLDPDVSATQQLLPTARAFPCAVLVLGCATSWLFTFYLCPFGKINQNVCDHYVLLHPVTFTQWESIQQQQQLLPARSLPCVNQVLGAATWVIILYLCSPGKIDTRLLRYAPNDPSSPCLPRQISKSSLLSPVGGIAPSATASSPLTVIRYACRLVLLSIRYALSRFGPATCGGYLPCPHNQPCDWFPHRLPLS